MSLAALPAIGEDTRTHAELSALLDALRVRGDSLPAGVQELSAPSLLPRVPVRAAVRRRFYSSDLVLRRPADSPGGGDGGSLRRAAISKATAEAELLRLRRRRTRSETHVPLAAREHFALLQQLAADGGDEAELDEEDDVDDENGASHRDEELKRLLGAKPMPRRASDLESGSAASSAASSLYSSPASTPHSRSLSFATDHDSAESLDKLRNLQKLFQEGFITVTEYKDRRLQLVDELGMPERTIAKATDLIMTDLPIVYRAPPDFSLLRERDAIKHIFDSEQRMWTSYRIKVKLDTHPFARGGLRQVFHMQDLSANSSSSSSESYVAKVAINPNENPDTYFRDVEMQAVASKFARLYNSYNPPRRVEFLAAWLLQLMPAGGGDPSELTLSGTICGVEPFIAGEYHKHNNNFGFVSDLERNTPQAFSHFTYEASGRQILVVDIQGVGDHYTDPQIHTRLGKEFGKGNLARRGFERFLESHRCNAICRYLKLPLNNPKDADPAPSASGGASGTVPAQPFMSQPRVRVDRVDSELVHYYGDSSAFQSYKARRRGAQSPPQPPRQLELSGRLAAPRSGQPSAVQSFVETMKTQRGCSAWCGINSCHVS
ncbi:hypothetical protein PybrP1_010427 [[Pythium] brassicae (nom. inval.)]|nr:hypothetical protein PybrP1_010427 [[Pythium] brassicae (nom. inval.)]